MALAFDWRTFILSRARIFVRTEPGGIVADRKPRIPDQDDRKRARPAALDRAPTPVGW